MVDANKAKAENMRIAKVLRALENNNMNAVYVQTKEDALKVVKQLVPPSSMTGTGGSATLAQCGITDYLRKETNYTDRAQKGLDRDEVRRRDGLIFLSDWYLTSANAITEHGEIYQVDGRSNRISALAFGPENVIIVAGINKIVPHLRAAVERVKRQAAPANCIRLDVDSVCAKTGVCVSPSFDENDLMCHADCGNGTICCNTLIMKRQRVKGRVTVIIVGEELGY